MTNPLNRYRDASPELKASLNDATKRWRKSNHTRIAEIRRRTDLKRKDTRRNIKYIKQYGITLDEYNLMLVSQSGVCAICHRPERLLDRGGKVRPLCVDHNHNTGSIRGLLCSTCNLALGNLDESIDYLLNSIDYIRKYNVI